MQKQARRVVITGLGVIAPNGIGKDAFWQANIMGQSGIRPITRFDPHPFATRIAGDVPDFDPQVLGLTPLECTSLDRATQFAIAASNLALEDAGIAQTLSEDERDTMGVYIGTAMAYLEEGEKFWKRATNNGTHEVQADKASTPQSLLMTHASVAAIAEHYQLHGPVWCLPLAALLVPMQLGKRFTRFAKAVPNACLLVEQTLPSLR